MPRRTVRRLLSRASSIIATIAVAACALTSTGEAAPASSPGAKLVGALPLSSTTAAMTLDQLAAQIDATPSAKRAATAAPQRTPKTAAQLAANARPGGYTYEVDSRKYAPTNRMPAALVDIVTPDECMQKYLDGFSGDYWFKNRFAACRSMILLGDYQVCSNGKCRVVGRWKIDLAYVFNMANNARSTELQIKMSGLRTDPGVPDTAPLNFSVGCWDPDPAGPNCNPVTSSFDHTAAQWNTIGVQSIVIRFEGESHPIPADPALNEHRSFYDLTPYFYLGNGTNSSTFVQAPVANTRCDIARTAVNPQYARTSDCVFHKVAGIFKMSASDPEVAESAQFIRDAQTNITSTYPGTPGTYVPGQWDKTPPLTRLYYDEPMRNANRTTSIEACIAKWGKDYTVRPNPSVPGETNDCDEYPFAGTHEGSYLVKQKLTPGSFAVRPLLSAHNQKAGSRLGVWEADDHILEEDPFYTMITD
jgi:hypothetical protein